MLISSSEKETNLSVSITDDVDHQSNGAVLFVNITAPNRTLNMRCAHTEILRNSYVEYTKI